MATVNKSIEDSLYKAIFLKIIQIFALGLCYVLNRISYAGFLSSCRCCSFLVRLLNFCHFYCSQNTLRLYCLGKIRSIGVSNFELEDLKTLQSMKTKQISVVQNWFDPFYTDDDVRKWCKDNGVAYIGYR